MGWNQSTYKPDAINDQVKRFTLKDRPNRAHRRYFKSVKEKLMKEFSKANLKMINYDSQQVIVDTLPRLDTHAGYSMLLTGERKKSGYIEGLLENYSYEEARAKENNSFNKPILIGSRTQGKAPYDARTGEFDDEAAKDCWALKKTRLVSMIDIYQILGECKFAVPFQRHLSTTDWYAGGKNDAWITRTLYEARRQYREWKSIDYSHYDQSIPAWLIREAFDIVREAFDKSTFDDKLFTIIREDFIHKVFITSEGLVESHKGVPSGSMFTQIIDSLANYLMIGAYMKQQHINSYKMFIMGDDNLIFTDFPIDTHDMSKFLDVDYGIVMNPAKADEGNRFIDPMFLSRIWTEHGPFRVPEIIIAKLLFPEHRREYDKFNFSPVMVVESYFTSFRLGMDKCFDINKHQAISRDEMKKVSAGKWLSGLERFNQLYLENSA